MLSLELLPTSLRAALATPDRLAFDGDPDVSAGAILSRGRWIPPAEVSPEMLGAARQYVRDYERAQAPPPAEVILEWLARLSGGIPHNMGGKVLELRLEQLVEAVEDSPAYVWSRENRKRAAGHFAHVPASKELIAWVDQITAEERERVRRLMAIIDTGNRPAAPRPAPAHGGAWNKEIAEEHGRKLAEQRRRDLEELGRIMRERDAQGAAQSAAAKSIGGTLSKVAADLKNGRHPPRPDIAERAKAPAEAAE